MNAEPVQFDWRGLSCPEPIIHMARAARDLHSSGGVLHVLADDAAFPADLESWCRSSGAELLNIRRTSGAFRAEVRVSSQNRQGPVAEAQHSSSPTAAKDLVLDCRGQSCPEPILKLARFVRELPPTTVQFEVLATDPAFPADVESWCRSAGVTLHTLEELPQHIRAVIHLSERTTVQPTKLKATSKPPAAPSRRPSSEAATAGAHEPGEAVNTIHFDLCGLDKVQRQARLDALSHMAFEGTLITLLADSAEFGVELTAWCATYGHALRHFEVRDGHHHATIVPTSNPHSTLPVPLSEAQKHKRCTILVLHNDFEALVAALMIANGAASMGMDTTMFFTFWGLNLLRGQTRRDVPGDAHPTLIQRMMGWMMPRGPRQQKMGKMHMGGVGKALMTSLMKQHSVMSLEQLLYSAADQGVRFVACTTSMSIMGITKGDLIAFEGLSYGGVASFAQDAAASDLHLSF